MTAMIRLMSGNEAVALGAVEAGLSYASGYPGTPSTEILEQLAEFRDEVIAEWAPNEKVALECAIGASIAGARSLAAMKMVGVNVAADPLFSAAYSGVNGGLVLVSADDPGLHSSQNEQDNRFYAPFAKVPMLEPSDSQEAHDMVKAAFAISETYDAPVLLRMTTRVCHSKSLVVTGNRKKAVRRPYARNVAKYDLVPGNARPLRANLEHKMKRLAEFAEGTEFNRLEWNGPGIGVIASGMGYQYAREVFGERASYLKLGLTHPLPVRMIADFAARVETLYVVEELEPYLENQIKQLGIACVGKDHIPPMYELNPSILVKTLLNKPTPTIECDTAAAPPRPPMLCAGCPHRGFFVELGKIAKRQKTMIAGDIGCYALGLAPPLEAQDLLICMGAAPSVGHGAQRVFDKFAEGTRVVATFGDSTFFHTGIPSVLNLVYNNSNVIVCILDNRITAMTGQQENPGTGVTLQGAPTKEADIEAVVRALGVEHVRVVNPMDLREVRQALKWAFGLSTPSVIVTKWPCVLKSLRGAEKTKYAHKSRTVKVREEACNGCRSCLKIGCPAISFDAARERASIDQEVCVGCEVCNQVCGSDAIVNGEPAYA